MSFYRGWEYGGFWPENQVLSLMVVEVPLTLTDSMPALGF